MKRSQPSRRRFIKTAGMTGGLLLLRPWDLAQVRVPGPKACAQYTRKNIKNLTDAELTALKNGVQAMKARPESTPTSWLYQANIHGTFDTPVLTAWKTCQHNLLFFLSWHRMYLYYFERILRSASGSATFALPYWNYFDATARQIPLAYRIPANASNPLWESNRGLTMGSGGSLPPSAVDHMPAFAYVSFNSFSPGLQSTPHNDVHSTIAGGMGSFEFAGRDPVFWLHHCNIDRLWNRWISQGGGRADPVSNSSWMNTMFTFFDETGTQVQMSGSQVVNTASQLKYCYDEEGRGWFPVERRVPSKERLRGILASSSKVELTATTSRLVLKLDEKAKAKLSRAVARSAEDAAGPQLSLEFEGAEGKPPEGYFEIYINLPETVRDPNYRSPYYAGNVSFFGLDSEHAAEAHEKPPFRVPVTNGLRRLAARKLLNDNALTLTFVGRGAISVEGRQLPLSAEARVRLERVTLSIEE